MSEIAQRVAELEARLSRVSEVLQRASDDVMAVQLLLYATIQSHPAPHSLIAAVSAEREKFMAAALNRTVSEKLIDRVNDLAQQAIVLATARLAQDN